MANEKQQPAHISNKRTRSYWTEHEDKVLLQTAIEVKRTTKSLRWIVIASFLPHRTAKQCRDRWNNYVNPDLNKCPLTWSETELIKKLHLVYGSKWSMIASKLNNRSENTVKNWYRKFERKNVKDQGSQEMWSLLSGNIIKEDNMIKKRGAYKKCDSFQKGNNVYFYGPHCG